jgi:hypothetical protein
MRFRRPAVLTTVVAAVALLVAACGSNSPSSGGRPTQAQLQQVQHEVVRFADCMRGHGVSDFPDPTTSPYQFKQALAPSTTHSPAFHSAATACQHLLPVPGRSQGPDHSQRQIAAALAFARCMRGRGFPSFPDPTSSGDLSHQMLARAGIDIHLLATQQAADACVGVTHGLLTKAAVARFVAGH